MFWWQNVAPTTNAVWYFACVMTVWTNFCFLEETNTMIGESISEEMPAAVHLYCFLVQGYVGQTAFLLVKPQQ